MDEETLESLDPGGGSWPRSKPVDTPELAYALIGTYYKENYRRLVRLVGGRFRSLDGEDLVQDLFNKILDGVDSCSTAELEVHVYRWSQDGFVTRALLNACLDRVGAAGHQRDQVLDLEGVDAASTWETLEPSPDSADPYTAPLTPEEVAGRLDGLRRRTAVRAMVQVLYERGQRPSKKHPYLTGGQHQTLVALYSSGPATDDGPPLSDRELHTLALLQNERARERWVDQRGYSNPESGSQSFAASRLGVSRQAISKTLQSVRKSMIMVHYVAGVLAPEQTLLDSDTIHRHVDAYERLDEQAMHAGYQQRLASAAAAVRKTAATGTRVQPLMLENPAALTLPELVTGLHEAEQSLAGLTGTPDPNCVAVCAAHTRRPDRVTEVFF